MPRTFPTGLAAMLNRQDPQIETHSTLDIEFFDGLNLTMHRSATAKLNIFGVVYEADLDSGGEIKSSLTRAVDTAEVLLRNASISLGTGFLRAIEDLYGATTRFGRYWRDLSSGEEYHKVLFTGVVAGVSVDQDFVRLRLLAEAYAGISVGASRRVARSCQWRFRDPATCGYSGAELVCNFLLDNAGGCEGRHGTPLKMAKYGGFVYIETKQSLAGAAALPLPASNQLVKSLSGSTFTAVEQRPFVAFENATVVDDPTNNATVVTMTGGGALGEDPVISGPTPTLTFEDTDALAPDFIHELNAGVYFLHFVLGPVLMSFAESTGIITFTSAATVSAFLLNVLNSFSAPVIKDTNQNESIILTPTASAVNEFTIANAAAGLGPTLSATGSSTDIPINITPKGTGVVSITSRIQLPNSVSLIAGTGAPEGSVTASPGSKFFRDNGTVYTKATGTGNTGWTLDLSGSALGEDVVIEGATPTLEFRDNDGGAPDFIHELNAGIYFLRFVGGSTLMSFTQSTGAITFTSAAPVSAVNLAVSGNFSAPIIRDTNLNESLILTATASAVNEFTVANAAAGLGPTLSATGSDTNIPINIAPKGTGVTSIASRILLPNSVSLIAGTGTPEAAVTASPGSKFFRDNGTVYTKVTGTGNTGWVLDVNGGGALGEDPVISGATPTLTFEDTDASAPDFIHELNAGVYFLRFVGGSTLMSFTQATNVISFTSAATVSAFALNVSSSFSTPVIKDTAGNEAINITATASATNEFTVANAPNGSGPTLSATGSSDANISPNINPKGTGTVVSTGDASVNAQMQLNRLVGTNNTGGGLVVNGTASGGASSTDGRWRMGYFDVTGLFFPALWGGAASAAPTTSNFCLQVDDRNLDTGSVVFNAPGTSGSIAFRTNNGFSVPALSVRSSTNGQTVGVNIDPSTIAAQMHAVSGSASRTAFRADSAASPSVPVTEVRNNTTAVHQVWGAPWQVQKEATTDPTSTQLTAGDHFAMYKKNDKLVFAVNIGGTINYLSIDLDGADTSWSWSTTAP